MSNTYYDSQLTAEEIEAALEAINGVIAPANNGKVLAIENGLIVAKSVTEYLDIDLQSKTITPSASQQTVTPDSGYDGLSSVVVNGDADLVAGNIKKDVEIFGVTGSYEGGASPTLQSKTVTPSASQQNVQPDSGYDGLSSVVVNGDADLVAGNIKKNVEIFGVTGTYEGSGVGSLDGKYALVENTSAATLDSGCVTVSGHHAKAVYKFTAGSSWGKGAILATIPSGIRPAGVSFFRLGNGGNNGVRYGNVSPSGNLEIRSSSSMGNYGYFVAEWDIPESTASVENINSVVTDITGDIAIIGDICYASLYLSLSQETSGWADLFSIPSSIAPQTAPGAIFYRHPYDADSNMSPVVKDTSYSAETRMFRVWIASGTHKGIFESTWVIGQ